MLLNKLAEHCDLPSCFNAWCDCGWKGRRAYGVVYVPGTNVMCDPINNDNTCCPKCKKLYHQLMTVSDFTARFQWAMDQIFRLPGRGDPVLFPCLCSHSPPMQMIDELTFYALVIGGTCLGGGGYWIAFASQVKCRGCFAQGEVKAIEYHPACDVDDWFDMKRLDTGRTLYIPRLVRRFCEV